MIKTLKAEKFYLILFWLSYTFLCVYFFLERSTYSDNSYYLFEIIQNKAFCIQYDRYFSVLTQILPLTAVKLHLSLKAVLLAYSLNAVFLYLALFLLIRFLTKEKWISYIFLLAISITIHHAFFYVNDEMAQASPCLILMIAVLRSERLKNLYKLCLLIIVIMLMQFAHLFLMIAASMILFLCFLEKKDKIALTGFAVILCIVLLKTTLLKGGRDGGSIDSLDWRYITLRNIHSSPFAKYFIHSIYKYYFPAIIVMIVLLYNNKIRFITKFFLLLGFIVLYILLVVYLRYGADEMYIDKYLSIIFYLFWAIIAYIISSKNNIKITLQILILFALVYSFSCLLNEKKYSERIDYLKTMMKGNEIKQIYLHENMPDLIKSMSWSVPYETLIISSLENETKTILIKESFYKIDEYLNDKEKFLGAEWTFPMKIKLNERYFKLKDGLYEYKP